MAQGQGLVPILGLVLAAFAWKKAQKTEKSQTQELSIPKTLVQSAATAATVNSVDSTTYAAQGYVKVVFTATDTSGVTITFTHADQRYRIPSVIAADADARALAWNVEPSTAGFVIKAGTTVNTTQYEIFLKFN